MRNSEINAPFADVLKFLDANECRHGLDEEGKIWLRLDGDNLQWRCIAAARKNRLAMVSLLPVKASRTRRLACAELLVRCNWNLEMGHFDMDMEDGELRFRTVAPYSGDAICPEIFEQLLCAHTVVVDRLFPAIAAVLHSNIAPESALDQAVACAAAEQVPPRVGLN